MKKLFEQPELMVVRMNNYDIMTQSLAVDGTASEADAADRFSRESWDAGY